jgi:hypothetical protein
MCFVLLNKQEKREVVVIHEALSVTGEFSNILAPNPIYGFIAKCVSVVLAKILYADIFVVVEVELIKFTVNHIKMLVDEEVPDRVDLLFIFQSLKSCKQFAVLEVSVLDVSIIIPVEFEENPLYYRVRILFLKLRSGLQKFKTWMQLKDASHQNPEILRCQITLIFLVQKSVASF